MFTLSRRSKTCKHKKETLASGWDENEKDEPSVCAFLLVCFGPSLPLRFSCTDSLSWTANQSDFFVPTFFGVTMFRKETTVRDTPTWVGRRECPTASNGLWLPKSGWCVRGFTCWDKHYWLSSWLQVKRECESGCMKLLNNTPTYPCDLFLCISACRSLLLFVSFCVSLST